jgi:hypothetical protein
MLTKSAQAVPILQDNHQFMLDLERLIMLIQKPIDQNRGSLPSTLFNRSAH